MSRIGRKPVPVPKGVTISQKDGEVGVKGPKGELLKQIPMGVAIKVEGDKLLINRADEPIRYVYLSPCDAGEWGEDRLGESERAMLMGGACAKAYGWSPKKT